MRTAYLLITLLYSIPVFSQTNSVLTEYIQTGLKNNLAIQQKQASYRKSIFALQEAKGLFMPYISMQARYTVADGGRIIEFPVGDLLNPVYSTLNLLTSALPPQQQFPEQQVENQEFSFYRTKEQETKLQLKQPLFHPQIYFNHKIKQKLVKTAKYDIITFKRQLVADIKTAYFSYLKTLHLLRILDETALLLDENIRVSKKLYENDKVTIDYVYRSETERNKLEQEQAVAVKQNKTAAAYFNFLLNRNLSHSIEINESDKLPVIETNVSQAQMQAQSREELQQLETLWNVKKQQVKMNKYNRFPTLSAVVDYGFQGTEYEFNGEQDFVMASLVLRWDLFEGLQNHRKIQQTQTELEQIRLKYKELQKHIDLQVIDVFYALEAAYKSIEAAKKQQITAAKTFRLVAQKYKQGQATLIAFIDARTSFTKAKQNLIISEYDFLIKYADFERVTALYPLK